MAFQAMIKPTKTGKNAHHGVTNVYVGQVGKPLDPTVLDGWFLLDNAVSIPEFNKASNPLQITAGLTKALLLNIPQDEVKEMSFSFNFWGLQALQMSLASDVAVTVNLASDGQTTVASGGSKTGATLTSAANIAQGDMVIVNLEHATFGGFSEITTITKVTGNVVEFEPLPIAPANSATFKKIAGLGTGTDKDDTGIIIPDTVTTTYPRVQLLIVTDETNESTFHRHIPEFEITGGMQPNYNEVLATIGFTGTPIVQEEETFTLIDGSTASRSWCMDSYLVPIAS